MNVERIDNQKAREAGFASMVRKEPWIIEIATDEEKRQQLLDAVWKTQSELYRSLAPTAAVADNLVETQKTNFDASFAIKGDGLNNGEINAYCARMLHSIDTARIYNPEFDRVIDNIRGVNPIVEQSQSPFDESVLQEGITSVLPIMKR